MTKFQCADEALAARYPLLFTDVRCGVSIGMGWFDIVCELADAIIATGKPVVVDQVKEKFGGLRFYVGPALPEVHDLIAKAEIRCAITCEYCGAPGKLRTGGWMKTLCRSCAKERV